MIESSLLLFNTNAVALFLALFICFHEIQRLLCMGKIEKNSKNRTLHKRNALSSFFFEDNSDCNQIKISLNTNSILKCTQNCLKQGIVGQCKNTKWVQSSY